MKKIYIIFLIVVILFALYANTLKGMPVNELKDNPIVLYKISWKEVIMCSNQEFIKFVYLNCEFTMDCIDNWPDGYSFQLRDKAVCCNGYCGEFIN